MGKFYRFNRILIGGPMGLAAWGMSGLCIAGIATWGLDAVVPVLVIKGASWGLWGAGVLRESLVTRARY